MKYSNNLKGKMGGKVPAKKQTGGMPSKGKGLKGTKVKLSNKKTKIIGKK